MKTRLLRCLRRNANEDGTWSGSKEDVAAALDVTLSPVQKAFAALVREGKILVVTKGGGRGRCTVYEIVSRTPNPVSRDEIQKGVQTVVPAKGVPSSGNPFQSGKSLLELMGFPAPSQVPERSRPAPPQARFEDTVSPAPRPIPSPSPVSWPPRVFPIDPMLGWELCSTFGDSWEFQCRTGDHVIGSVRVYRQQDGRLAFERTGGLGLSGGLPSEADPKKLVDHLHRTEPRSRPG